ncbi:hypothetical protein [Sporisorium scitamineum]|nr:hypothetical protein [Sporisorium scitamineum]
MLVKLTEHNDSLPLHPSALTRFHSRATPNITLSAYLRRIAKYTSIEKCCVLILLVYIDRICERLQGFTICGLTVHRFICAAILCASKALCDAFNTNEHYAKVGGISLQEINLLEKEFLQIIDWRLTCSGAVLQHYYASLVRSHKDYVLAEPRQGQQDVAGGMEVDAVEGGLGANGNGERSSDSSGNVSGSSANGPSSARLAAAPSSTAVNSQHSSPFPISSSSASPYTPSSTNRTGGLVATATSSTSGNSGSSRSAPSTTTSPVSAMQVDTEPALAAPTSRRRKDQHRTPPSLRDHAGNIAVDLPRENGAQHQQQGSANGGVDAYKRTRFDPYPPT